jgi:hypothetical protein
MPIDLKQWCQLTVQGRSPLKLLCFAQFLAQKTTWMILKTHLNPLKPTKTHQISSGCHLAASMIQSKPSTICGSTTRFCRHLTHAQAPEVHSFLFILDLRSSTPPPLSGLGSRGAGSCKLISTHTITCSVSTFNLK